MYIDFGSISKRLTTNDLFNKNESDNELLKIDSNQHLEKKAKSQQIEDEEESSSDLDTYLQKLDSPFVKLK